MKFMQGEFSHSSEDNHELVSPALANVKKADAHSSNRYYSLKSHNSSHSHLILDFRYYENNYESAMHAGCPNLFKIVDFETKISSVSNKLK